MQAAAIAKSKALRTAKDREGPKETEQDRQNDSKADG